MFLVSARCSSVFISLRFNLHHFCCNEVTGAHFHHLPSAQTAFTVIVWTEDPPSLLTPLSTAPRNKHTKILQLSAHHQNKTNPSIQVVPFFSNTFAVVVHDELKPSTININHFFYFIFYFLFFPAVTSLSKPISQSPKYFLLSGFNVRRL